jgi:hypothetical protein
MNERIEKLAEQAGFRSNPDIYDRNQSFDIGKFAELIIRECAELVRKHNYESIKNDEPYGITSDGIMKHFGIKE